MKCIKFIVFFFMSCMIVFEVRTCYLPIATSNSACDTLEQFLVTREKWGATESSSPMTCLWSPVKYIIIHHTVTNPCASFKSCCEYIKNIQAQHKTQKNWPDIGYHFLIGGDGKAYQGRPWYIAGAHTKYHNQKSIGIAFIGEYTKESPGIEMLNLVPKIAYCGVQKGYIRPDFLVIGHRDAFCTSCPGTALYDVIKKWPRYPKTVPVPSYTCDAQNDTKSSTASPTTTVMPTTEAPTTETIAETTVTSNEPTSETPIPIYYYVILCKKSWPCIFD